MSDQQDEVAAQRALRELRSQWQPALDADNDALDADVVARLAQARSQALRTDALPASVGRRRILLAVPAVAAVVLVLALPLTQQMMQKKMPQHDQLGVPSVSGLDLDVSEVEPWQEDVELLDDLDFYAWLELEAAHAS
jgi:hypothetical protein